MSPDSPPTPSEPSEDRETDLDARLQRARELAGLDADEETETRQNGFGEALRLSMELVAPVLVGGFLGLWIDKWAGTTPLFLLLLFVLGGVAGLRNIIRQARAGQAEADENE